jgi:hypothetical protein
VIKVCWPRQTLRKHSLYVQDYAIYFEILPSDPPFALFLIIFIYEYLSYLSVGFLTMIEEISFEMLLVSSYLLVLIPRFYCHSAGLVLQ